MVPSGDQRGDQREEDYPRGERRLPQAPALYRDRSPLGIELAEPPDQIAPILAEHGPRLAWHRHAVRRGERFRYVVGGEVPERDVVHPLGFDSHLARQNTLAIRRVVRCPATRVRLQHQRVPISDMVLTSLWQITANKWFAMYRLQRQYPMACVLIPAKTYLHPGNEPERAHRRGFGRGGGSTRDRGHGCSAKEPRPRLSGKGPSASHRRRNLVDSRVLRQLCEVCRPVPCRFSIERGF